MLLKEIDYRARALSLVLQDDVPKSMLAGVCSKMPCQMTIVIRPLDSRVTYKAWIIPGM